MGLLLVWYFRLEPLRLYPTGFYLFWAGFRLVLRYLSLVFLLISLSVLPLEPLPAYRLIVIEASMPEAWEAARAILRQPTGPGVRTGLLALKGERAIWVIPPTQDTSLYEWGLAFQAGVRAEPLDQKEAVKSLKLLLSGVELAHIAQFVWIGTVKLDPPPIEGPIYFLRLARGVRFSEYVPLDEPASLPAISANGRKGSGFVVATAILLAVVLLGDGVLGRLLRNNLASYKLSKLLDQRIEGH